MKYHSPVIITSHLNSEEKNITAKNLISNLKSFDNTVILVGNYPFDKEIQKLTDYTVYIEKNPILNGKFYCWTLIDSSWDVPYKYYLEYSFDYGLSHLMLMKSGFQFVKNLGYSDAIHVNYDVDFASTEWQFINSHENIIFSRPEYLYQMSTLLYKMEVIPFINAVDKGMDHYQRKTTLLPETDILLERILKWILDEYNISYNQLIGNPTSTHSFLEKRLTDGMEVKVFYNEMDNRLFLRVFGDYDDTISFDVNGFEVIAKKTNEISQMYELDVYHNSTYTHQGKEIFTLDDSIKQQYVLSNNN